MLKLELQESAAVALLFTAFAFTARMSFIPLHLHTCLTPWSVFQDGSPVRASLNNLRQAGSRHSLARRKSSLVQAPQKDQKTGKWYRVVYQCALPKQ